MVLSRIYPRRDELIKARDKLESQAHHGTGGALLELKRSWEFGDRPGFGNGNIAMKNEPVEDVFPIEHGDIPVPYC